tara:strand:+ start:11553 stop:12587 length:1035 start_codon:yes stop_codon:yes gene_type:complete
MRFHVFIRPFPNLRPRLRARLAPLTRTMPVIPIVLTVASACAINVGKAIQKKAAESLPKLALSTLPSYVRDPLWRRGLELDVIGGAGVLLALSVAPMSVVQPASASGVAVLAAISHVYLGETLSLREWRGVASCAFGIVLFSRFARSGGASAPPGMMRLFIAIALGLASVMTPSVVAKRFERETASARAKRVTLIKTGAQCGTCFALSSACVKIGMAYLHAWALFSAPIAFCTAGTLTGCGLYFQTKGFKDGNSIVVVCVAGNVSQMCVAAVYGLLILGEPLPETFFALFGWVTSWAFILYGVVALSGAESGAVLAHARDVRGVSVLPTTIGPGASHGALRKTN